MTHHSDNTPTPTDDDLEDLRYLLDEELSDVANLLGKDEVGGIADAILAAGFRRSQPQGEPSDASVLAALNEWYGGPKDSSLGDYSQMAENAMRAALRAASAVTEQGENKGMNR